MRIIPAIDLKDGKCVRLQQGDYDRETIFGDDPVATARRWLDGGAECLHLVDLDGARKTAEDIDQRTAKGEWPGLLAGMTLAITSGAFDLSVFRSVDVVSDVLTEGCAVNNRIATCNDHRSRLDSRKDRANVNVSDPRDGFTSGARGR